MPAVYDLKEKQVHRKARWGLVALVCPTAEAWLCQLNDHMTPGNPRSTSINETASSASSANSASEQHVKFRVCGRVEWAFESLNVHPHCFLAVQDAGASSRAGCLSAHHCSTEPAT